MDEFYHSMDNDVDGPIPGPHLMLSFGPRFMPPTKLWTGHSKPI